MSRVRQVKREREAITYETVAKREREAIAYDNRISLLVDAAGHKTVIQREREDTVSYKPTISY